VLHILASQVYMNESFIKALYEHKGEYDLIVDSGAFTAFNAGKVVTLEAYEQFLKTIEFLKPFRFVQLDVVGDEQASMANLLKMKEKGLDPIPVFTRGASLETLEEMYRIADFIMVGGIAKASSDKDNDYIKYISHKINGRKNHLLGVTRLDAIKISKCTSVDSSSWMRTSRYGIIDLCRADGTFKSITKREITKNQAEITNCCKLIGFPLQVVKAFNAHSFVNNNYGTEITKAQTFSTMNHIHQSKIIEARTGTRVYFACASAVHFLHVLNIYQRMEKGL
jgi:hypothetical protein